MRDDLGLVPTPVTLDQARTILRIALATPITPNAEDVILAHIAFENGNGTRVIHWNFGNLVATRAWTGDFWRPPWFRSPEPGGSPELRRKHELMLKGKVPAAFRAYASPVAGMRSYLDTLDELGLLAVAQSGPRAFAERATLRFSPNADPLTLARTLENIVERIKTTNGDPPNRTSDLVALGLLSVMGVAVAFDVLRGK